MQRRQIKEQIGVLEEQLELMAESYPSGQLSEILVHEALTTTQAIAKNIFDQHLSKSVAATDFIQRIIGIMARDAAAMGVEIAISHYGEGKITLDMAELITGPVLAGLRASLHGLKSASRDWRAQNHLFPTGTLYLEARATASEILFRLVDDTFFDPAVSDTGGHRYFTKLRTYIAGAGGWFRQAPLGGTGRIIEFKIPMLTSRTDVYVLREDGFEALLPAAFVMEISTDMARNRAHGASKMALLSENCGLTPAKRSCPVQVRVSVADYQFWIGCDAVVSRTNARSIAAGDLVQEGAWIRNLGIFNERGVQRVLPVLEGPALIQFCHDGGSAV